MQTIRLCSLRRVGTGRATIRRTRAGSSSPARRASPAPARRHRARAARVVQQARRCAPLLHIHSFARAPLQTLTLRRGGVGQGWGKMFLIFFCLAAGVYVFGTVGYKFKVQDARGGDLVRPS